MAINNASYPPLQSSDFDFAQNCTATSELYNAWFKNVSDLLPYCLPLLLPNVKNQSEEVMRERWLESNISYTFLDVGIRPCRGVVCQNLNFTGNADIAGIGSLIAYISICAVTTALSALSLNLFDFRGSLPSRKLLSTKFEGAMISVTTAYFETLLFFCLMTLIAFQAYIKVLHTNYEYYVAQMVFRLAISAVNAMTWTYAFQQEKSERFARMVIQVTAVLWSTVLVFGKGVHLLQYVDSPCFETYPLPAILLLTSTVTSFIFTMITVIASFYVITRFVVRRPELHPFWRQEFVKWRNRNGKYVKMTMFAGIVTEILAMWLNATVIVLVRQHGKEMFGSSYTDNFMGYGQILATGFCLQAIVQFLRIWICGPNPAAIAGEGDTSEQQSPLSQQQQQQSSTTTLDQVQWHDALGNQPTEAQIQPKP